MPVQQSSDCTPHRHPSAPLSARGGCGPPGRRWQTSRPVRDAPGVGLQRIGIQAGQGQGVSDTRRTAWAASASSLTRRRMKGAVMPISVAKVSQLVGASRIVESPIVARDEQIRPAARDACLHRRDGEVQRGGQAHHQRFVLGGRGEARDGVSPSGQSVKAPATSPPSASSSAKSLRFQAGRSIELPDREDFSGNRPKPIRVFPLGKIVCVSVKYCNKRHWRDE